MPSREKLPPVERAGEDTEATQIKVVPQVVDAHTSAEISATPVNENVSDLTSSSGGIAKSVAHWVHQHPQAHKHGAGVFIYQFLRSAVAAIPYGFSMAGILAGFTGMERLGARLANKQAASTLTKGFGRNLHGFASFGPAKWAALIGTSFTFYRGTSKLGKWMTEYLFNPKDSEARTAEKVHDLPQEAWRKIKEIAPAEVSSTPVAAVVLGFIVQAFQKPAEIVGSKLDWTRSNFKATQGAGAKLKLLKDVILKPEAKFVKQAAINSFGYALFFEMGDRLFKDTQIRRGVWPGEHHSIKALKAAPDEYEQGIKDGNITSNAPKYADSALEPVKEKNHYAFFTSEPGLGRFVFRRLLPTAAGITLYTGAKMRWAAMAGNDFQYAAGKMAPQFLKKAWGEGAATSLFFLIPIVSEPWEKMYDAFFAKKEKVAQLKDQMREHPEIIAKQTTPHQAQKYEELLAKVNAKERGAANDVIYSQRA